MKLDPLHFWLLALALCILVLAAACLLPYGDAACLEIRGNATGQGVHTLQVLPEMTNLTPREATFLLGPGHNFNVTKDGLVTFENGSTWMIIQCEGERR